MESKYLTTQANQLFTDFITLRGLHVLFGSFTIHLRLFQWFLSFFHSDIKKCSKSLESKFSGSPFNLGPGFQNHHPGTRKQRIYSRKKNVSLLPNNYSVIPPLHISKIFLQRLLSNMFQLKSSSVCYKCRSLKTHKTQLCKTHRKLLDTFETKDRNLARYLVVKDNYMQTNVERCNIISKKY